MQSKKNYPSSHLPTMPSHHAKTKERQIVRRSLAGPSTLASLKIATKPQDINEHTEEQTMADGSRNNIDIDKNQTETTAVKKNDQSKKEGCYVSDGKIFVVTEVVGQKEALCCKYSEEFDFIAVGYSDGLIKLFHSGTGQVAHTLFDTDVKDNRAPVTSVKHKSLSKSYPVSNSFTATYANGCIKCWSYNFNQCLYTIKEKRQTFGIVYHPRYPKFVTFGDNMKIYFYDEESKIQERVLTASDKPDKHDGHMSRVFAACFHPKNNYELLTGGWDDVVCFWDLRQPHAIRHVSGVHMCGEGIDINLRGTEVLTCSWQKEHPIQIFDYGSGKLIATYDPDIHYSKLYCGRYANKDFMVTAGTDPNLIRIVDLKTTATSAYINQLPGAVYSLDIGAAKQAKRPILERLEKGNIKNDITSVPKIAFVSQKNLYQVDFI